MVYLMRFAAHLLDGLVLFLLYSLMILVVSQYRTPDAETIRGLYFGLLLLHFVYHMLFEGFLRTTPGKALFKLTLQHQNEKLTWLHLLNRNAIRTLEATLLFIPVPVLLLLARKTPHELISGTLTLRRIPTSNTLP